LAEDTASASSLASAYALILLADDEPHLVQLAETPDFEPKKFPQVHRKSTHSPTMQPLRFRGS
jgi:hypothetical protein